MMNIQGLMSGFFFIGLALWPFSWKLELARNGRTDYVVVQSEQATEPEKYAVSELTNFLSRVTGATFPVVLESSLSGQTRGIYVGGTAYAKQNGIEAARLGEEEWIIRSVGKNLVLAGGRPRGTMYAVYEFLERQVGCHWLDRDTEVVPNKPALALGKLDIRGKPRFWKRELASATGCQGEWLPEGGWSSPAVSKRWYDDKWKFLVRNKTYRYDVNPRLKDMFPEGAFYRLDGSLYGHSFSACVNASNWFETHPEYFSLNAQGKRVPAYDGAGPGQLCLTHPDVRALTKKKLRDVIAKDRAEASRKGCPPPRVYMIGQNDVYDAHCQCTNCQAIARREGSESGPLIDFINSIAEDIEKDYPDVLVSTMAYHLTQKPPKTLKPRSNVIIAWCDMSSDLMRPLNHPSNAKNYNEIMAWGAAAPRLAIGDDYWIFYGGLAQFPMPYCMVQCLGPDLKLFADCHAEAFFCETPDYMEAGENFTALKFWLAYQLLVNPYQPAEPLIKIFMDGYYGAASSKMNDYLEYLQKLMDKDPGYRTAYFDPYKVKYLDLNFFVTAGKLFDEAEALVKPGSREALHVQRERFIVDGALLQLWPWLDRKLAASEKMPFDHETLIRRYETNWRAHVKLYWHRFYSQAGRLDKLAALFRDPKLPEQFRNMPSRDVADFTWLNWLNFEGMYYPPSLLFVDDPQAAGGTALAFVDRKDEEFKKPLTFRVTGGPAVTLKPDEISRDGKYHVYKIGRVNVRAGTNSEASWGVSYAKGTTVCALNGDRFKVAVDALYVTNSPDKQANDWDAYISLKVKGPAYISGSAESNGVWIDRVLLVKPQPGDKPDASELLRREEEKKLEALKAVPPPQLRVPLAPKGACGDPLKVDWEQAAGAGAWRTLMGAASSRKVEARFAQDGEYLYARLAEDVDPSSLTNDPGIFGGDDWEMLFAGRRGEKPYRQIGINPKGAHLELDYGATSSKWESGVNVISKAGPNSWTTYVSFPMNLLLPGGVKGGQAFYANIFRGGAGPLAWSPTFEGGFHQLDRLGMIVVEK